MVGALLSYVTLATESVPLAPETTAESSLSPPTLSATDSLSRTTLVAGVSVRVIFEM